MLFAGQLWKNGIAQPHQSHVESGLLPIMTRREHETLSGDLRYVAMAQGIWCLGRLRVLWFRIEFEADPIKEIFIGCFHFESSNYITTGGEFEFIGFIIDFIWAKFNQSLIDEATHYLIKFGLVDI